MKKKERDAPLFLLILLAIVFLVTPVRLVRVTALLALLAYAGSFLYSRFIPRAITVTRPIPTIHAIKLQTLQIELIVQNRSVLPVSFFTITDATNGLRTSTSSAVISLRPGEERTVSYRVQGESRGAVPLGPITLEGSDPLGLLRWSRRVEVPGTAIIYPTIHRMALSYRRGNPSGTLAVNDKRYEDVTQFRSLREYVPGDDIKRINWKASAKNNKLFTTEFDSTLSLPVVVLFNFSRDDYPRRQRDALLERGAELAASVPFYYGGLGQEIGFVSSGLAPGSNEIPLRAIAGGYEHSQAILELISTLSPREGRADFRTLLFSSGLTIGTGTRVVVVSPPLTQGQAEVLVAARQRGGNILMLQVESQVERTVDEFVAGAFPIVGVRTVAGETIRE